MYQKNTLEPEHRPHSPPGHSHQAPDQKQCRPVWWKHDERARCLIVGADSYRYRGSSFWCAPKTLFALTHSLNRNVVNSLLADYSCQENGSPSQRPSSSWYFTPKCTFNFHSFSEEGWSSRSTTESKNQAEASHAAAKAGKRCRAAKKAKLNSIPASEKTISIISCSIRKTKAFWVLRSVIWRILCR